MRLTVDLNAISVFDQTARVPAVLGQTTCNRKPPKFGDPLNPYRMFNGIWIPESLVRYPLVSASAKLRSEVRNPSRSAS